MTEMKHEILFRGKRVKNGEWVEGWYFENWLGPIIKNDFDSYLVDQSTVGQYTGLKDSSGKKIFEGDILKWDEREWGEPYFEVVTWDYDLFAMRAKDWSEFCVVFGNIHDIPELLEKKEA